MNLEQTENELQSPRKIHHRIKSLNSDSLAMEWSAVHGPGIGLRNRNEAGKSLNICYINGVLQCLAHAPPFAQWLLNDHAHEECKLCSRIVAGVNSRTTHVCLRDLMFSIGERRNECALVAFRVAIFMINTSPIGLDYEKSVLRNSEKCHDFTTLFASYLMVSSTVFQCEKRQKTCLIFQEKCKYEL